jgi:hypothetical protein
MKKRSFLASLAIALTLVLAPAAANADAPGGPHLPFFPAPGGGSGAAGGSQCFQDYARCINAAANLPTFWGRTMAGLDCYVDLVGCVRRAAGLI